MSVNISFIKLKGKVTDNYELTKKNWFNKMVVWEDMRKVVSSSRVQYSCYEWKNGFKTPRNWKNNKQDIIILDLDDGMTIPEAQKRFNRYTHIIATTKSHRQDKKGIVCDRFRVIIKAINISNDRDIYFKALELFCEANDKQTLTTTASFLGYDDAIVIYNQGKELDMFYWNELAKEEIKEEKLSRIVIDPDLLPTYHGLGLDAIKEQLTYDVVIEVLESLGYEMERNAFRLRPDERTASCRVKHKSLNIVDYGGEFKGDIFQLLMDYHKKSFKESMNYISNFI